MIRLPNKNDKKISIVGAGPSGILLALYLLQRQDYQVDIYESRSDPRNSASAVTKNYPLILCQRGLVACRKIKQLETAIKRAGVVIEGAIRFSNNNKEYNSDRKPLVSINRTALVITLLNHLESKYPQDKFKLHFDSKYQQADFSQKQLTCSKTKQNGEVVNFTTDYDLLVGADGVHSAVRDSCARTGSFNFTKIPTRLAYKTLFLSALKENADNALILGRVYGWRSPAGITLLAAKQKAGGASCTLFIPSDDKSLNSLKTAEDVTKFFEMNFPIISSSISPAEAQDFLGKKMSDIWTVSCDHYHFEDSVMILGDAAHAISPSIGQGCNSALEDVAVIDSLLDRYEDDWTKALPEYSRCRVADAHAVRELADNSLPLTKGLFMLFIARLTIRRNLHKLFPKTFSLPFFDLIPDTTIAYSEIYNSAKNWIAMVKKSNQRFLSRVETSKID